MKYTFGEFAAYFLIATLGIISFVYVAQAVAVDASRVDWQQVRQNIHQWEVAHGFDDRCDCCCCNG